MKTIRDLWHSVATEPLPVEFVILLERLGKIDPGPAGGGKAGAKQSRRPIS